MQRVNAVDLSTCVITGTTNLAVTKRLALRLPLKGKDYTVKALCNRLPYLVSFTSDTIHFYVDTNNAQVFIPIGAKTRKKENTFYSTFSTLPSKLSSPLPKLLLTKPSPLMHPTPWCKRVTAQGLSWNTNAM